MNQPLPIGTAPAGAEALRGKTPLFAIPKKMQILSGSALKLIAVLAMLVDHTAHAFIGPGEPVLLSVFGKQVTLYWCMRAFGRIAFPIFAFLIVEGVRHTSDRVKYGVNLFVFALISEVPWDLLFYGKWFTAQKQNVFFTLFLAYMAIYLYERFSGAFWKQAASVLTLFALSFLLRADYTYAGFAFILMVYFLREHRLIQAVITAAGVLPNGFYAAFAYVPLLLYNGKRGFIKGKLKYAFYAFYPGHLLVLLLIRYLINRT